MIYTFLNLKLAGLLVGFALILSHAFPLLRPQAARNWLLAFPRSRGLGILLLVAAALWAFVLVATMDLGEFTVYRNLFLAVIPVSALLAGRYVDEFLSVRALGMLLLLAAEPLLESAFLRPEKSRLLLVVLAYAWTLFGMFWVGMPYLARDLIKWVSKSELRWKAASLLGLVYGVAILVSSFFYYNAV